MTIDDIRSFIVHWPNLSDLEVTFCNASEDKKTKRACIAFVRFLNRLFKIPRDYCVSAEVYFGM